MDRKAYFGDGETIWRDKLYTAQEARIKSLECAVQESECRFYCCGTDRFGNYCNAELNLNLSKDAKYEYKLKSKMHIKGCDQAFKFDEPQEDSDCRISRRISEFSIKDFYNAICKGYSYDQRIEAPDGMIYREPKNLEELYKKLSGAQLHLKTKNPELDVADIFFSSRTYRLYREKTRLVHGPMLVIAMSAYDKNIGDYCRETFRDKDSWLMQDPYEYSDPSDRICFILYGDRKTPDKENVNIRRVSERVTRKVIYDSNGNRRTNNDLYLILADWVPAVEFIRTHCPSQTDDDYKALTELPVVFGYIRNMRQFADLSEPMFREDLSSFHERIGQKYYETRW